MAGDTMELRILGPDVGSADPAVAPIPVQATSPAPGVLDGHGYLRRTVVPSRADLVDVLRRWADTSRRPTLGPVDAAGGRAHLRWTVGDDGVLDTVSYRDDDEPTPGWYAYLQPAAARPREL